VGRPQALTSVLASGRLCISASAAHGSNTEQQRGFWGGVLAIGAFSDRLRDRFARLAGCLLGRGLSRRAETGIATMKCGAEFFEMVPGFEMLIPKNTTHCLTCGSYVELIEMELGEDPAFPQSAVMVGFDEPVEKVH
jgi:hypothetical protein